MTNVQVVLVLLRVVVVVEDGDGKTAGEWVGLGRTTVETDQQKVEDRVATVHDFIVEL